MPSQSRKKIKSAPKTSSLVRIGVCVAAINAVVVIMILSAGPSYADLSAGGKSVRLDIADTEAAREKGLGERAGMPNDQGMLFILDQPAKTCFWMKGMRFPLDIIWLDSGKKVVTVAADLAPDTYPKSFCPSADSKYVIELNAGQSKALNIMSGDTLRLSPL